MQTEFTFNNEIKRELEAIGIELIEISKDADGYNIYLFKCVSDVLREELSLNFIYKFSCVADLLMDNRFSLKDKNFDKFRKEVKKVVKRIKG